MAFGGSWKFTTVKPAGLSASLTSCTVLKDARMYVLRSRADTAFLHQACLLHKLCFLSGSQTSDVVHSLQQSTSKQYENIADALS